jgi:uncharacterized membrane protein YkoI
MQIKQSILVFICCAMTATVFADDKSTAVTLAETPTVVREAITARVGDGKLGDISKTTENSETVYDVGLTAKDGQDRDFTMAEDGTLMSTQVTLIETPAAVQKSIQTLAREGEVESIDQSLDDSNVTYDISLTMSDGREKGFTLDVGGMLLSMEVSLAETPAAVQKTIQTEMADDKLENIDKMFDEDGITYDVDVTGKGGREMSYTVAEDGKLISRQVTLEETPPPVRRTIKERIGDGKILRIDRSFVKNKGVMPYEVQGRKDGKPFDFSVGPRGRFLGMD